MGIWSEIKYALNDTLAKKSFIPLNKIVEKENYENSINTISFVNSILEKDDNSFYAVDYGTEKIKAREFSENSILESVLMPNTIRKIENQSFKNCRALKKINIPENVEEIGYEAFLNCSSLKKINLLEKIKKINDSAFKGCTSLEEILFPSTIDHIGKSVVQGCTRLSEITIPMIGDSTGSQFFGSIFGAPSYMQQKDYVPGSLRKVTISGNITQIDSNAFYDCKLINQIVFPESLTSIGRDAFRGCESIDYIELPNALKFLGDGAFWNCWSLSSVFIGSRVIEAPELELNGGSHFAGCYNLLSITLLNNVKKIPATTFSGCINVTDILFLNPDIEIDNRAFLDCNKIDFITYNGTKKKWNDKNLTDKFFSERTITVKCTDGTITI